MFRTAVVISLFVSLVGAGMVTVRFASAIGGGGGGGGGSTAPVCDEDTWQCAGWSQCDVDGEQSRECVLVEDCPYASTVPATTQSCQPPCLVDYWQCSDWGSCGGDNTQTRNCILVEDCASAETAHPIESQTCQGSCEADQWTCGEWGECQLDGEQSRTCGKNFDCPSLDTAGPAFKQSCTPSCTADTFTCTDWGACDTSGDQFRDCTLTSDCSLTNDAPPVEQQLCDHLQCADLPTLRERVACREGLTPEGLARELQLRYLPETCAVLSGAEQTECVDYYRAFLPCWEFPVGETRFSCAERVLGLDNDIPSLKARCGVLSHDGEATACRDDLADDVYAMIAFRMYDLELRAEEFARLGVDLDLATDMVVSVVEHKIAFSAAQSYEERVAVLEDLREEWATFIVVVRQTLSR